MVEEKDGQQKHKCNKELSQKTKAVNGREIKEEEYPGEVLTVNNKRPALDQLW